MPYFCCCCLRQIRMFLASKRIATFNGVRIVFQLWNERSTIKFGMETRSRNPLKRIAFFSVRCTKRKTYVFAATHIHLLAHICT